LAVDEEDAAEDTVELEAALVLTVALVVLDPELDTGLVLGAVDEPVEAGEADVLTGPVDPELDTDVEDIAAPVVLSGAAFEVTQAHTASADVWTIKPVLTPHAAITQA
jgi:hypothetical protein